VIDVVLPLRYGVVYAFLKIYSEPNETLFNLMSELIADPYTHINGSNSVRLAAGLA